MTGARPSRPSRRRAGVLATALLALTLVAPPALIALVAPAAAAAPQPVAASPSPAAGANCQGTSTGGDPNIVVEYAPANSSDAESRQCTPAANSTLAGSWSVDIQARTTIDALASFAVSIVPTTGGIPALGSAATVTHSYCGGLLNLGLNANCPNPPNPDTIKLSWDTTSLTPYNGVYEISATAISDSSSLTGPLLGSGGVQNTTITGLSVNNPPVAPSGVSAGLSGTTPVVSWSPNPEPDVTGYVVFRSVSGTAFAPVGRTKATTFQDASAPQRSALSYEVVAVRSSPVASAGISSGASAATTAIIAGASGAAPIALPAPKLPAPPRVPALKSIGGPAAVPQVDNTFNPTLPFGNVPNTTETYSVPSSSGNPQALASDAGHSGTTTAQKLRYAALASMLLVLAVFVIGLARKVLRSH